VAVELVQLLLGRLVLRLLQASDDTRQGGGVMGNHGRLRSRHGERRRLPGRVFRQDSSQGRQYMTRLAGGLGQLAGRGVQLLHCRQSSLSGLAVPVSDDALRVGARSVGDALQDGGCGRVRGPRLGHQLWLERLKVLLDLRGCEPAGRDRGHRQLLDLEAVAADDRSAAAI